MLIKSRPSWHIPESAVTPEHVFFNRRAFITGTAAIAATSLTACGDQANGEDAAAGGEDHSAGLYPVERNGV